MNIKIHLLNANGQFDELGEVINTIFNDTIQKIISVIPIDNVDVIISDYPRNIIPNYGLGGTAWTPYRAELNIDPKFPNIKEQIKKKFPQTIAHELHHCLRMKNLGHTETLLDAIIQDGLADQFGVEITGLGPEAWSIAVKGEKLQELLKKAEKEFGNHDYNHSKWFFSHNKGDIPHWTGYSIGYYLVGEYLKNHPEAKASTLYAIKAEDFIK